MILPILEDSMITKEQCRAARSFLGLKQSDLAELCGLSKTAITHFESGLFRPRAENMASIQEALQSKGIEFVGDYGVQKKQINFKVLDTREKATRLPQLWEDIIDTLRHEGGEVLISHLCEKEAEQAHPEKLAEHLKNLKRYNISERLLVCEGDTYFLQDAHCYRWLKPEIFKAGLTTFLYGGKCAFQFWKGHFILIIDHPEIYNNEKERFEYLWGSAVLPPKIERKEI